MAFSKTTVRTSDTYRDAIRKMLPEWKGDILDVGTGEGVMLEDLPDACVKWGIDISSELLKIAEEKVPDAYFVTGDIAKMKFPDDIFDIVMMIDVFQYLADPLKELSEIKRVMKAGGKFVFTIPNRKWLYLDWYLNDHIHINPLNPRRSHIRYSLEEMKYIINLAGFKVTKWGGAEGIRWKLPLPNYYKKKLIFVCEKSLIAENKNKLYL